jgi:hypothetical protein
MVAPRFVSMAKKPASACSFETGWDCLGCDARSTPVGAIPLFEFRSKTVSGPPMAVAAYLFMEGRRRPASVRHRQLPTHKGQSRLTEADVGQPSDLPKGGKARHLSTATVTFLSASEFAKNAHMGSK